MFFEMNWLIENCAFVKVCAIGVGRDNLTHQACKSGIPEIFPVNSSHLQQFYHQFTLTFRFAPINKIEQTESRFFFGNSVYFF